MSQPGTLPTSDDFFGSTSPSGGLPTADQFFAPPQPSFGATLRNSVVSAVGSALDPAGLARGAADFGSAAISDVRHMYDSGDVHSSPAMDAFFTQKPVGRILHAFGQGAAQGWGAAPIGLSQDTEDLLKRAGVFNDYTSAHTTAARSFNEAFIRPAAAAIDASWRTLSAGFGGVQQAVAQAGAEASNTQTGHAIDVAARVAGFGSLKQLGTDTAAYMETPEGMGFVHNIPHITAVPPDLVRARSLAVIGEGEDGYFGTKEPTPETAADRGAAVRDQIASESQPEAPEATGSVAVEAAAPAAEAAPSEAPSAPANIHTIARQIAPDTFTAYDALAARQDTFRRWLSELNASRETDPRIASAQAEIDTILGKVGGVEDRLTKKAAARLDDIRDEMDDFRAKDTPDMARVRQALQANDFKMRDLAPDVAKAYRAAQDRLPAPAEASPSLSGNAELPIQPAAETAPALEALAGEPPAAAPAQPAASPNQGVSAPVDIAGDVSKKLVAAGRPAEEANAAAQIVAEHYAARASRLTGANAADLYRDDAPEIRIGQRRGAKTPEMAQRKSGSINIRQARTTIRLFENADASTFMHEVGHQWLEELMADAADERATDDVRKNAQTVHDWLGTKEGETIPTKAHEKFARGFERYLMEGRAPSKALAEVFAKFKAWLTQIYQTVQKFRSPINDDIRDVFDRLVTANPERTTIAADAAETKNLADTHEELAETTAPEQAATVADKVRSEIDAHASKVDLEIARELNPNGPEQPIAGEPAENAAPPSGGNETGSAARENGPATGAGEIAASRDATTAEGSAISGKPERGPTPEPTAANERFAEPESALVDKAGNIRLDNLSTPEDVNEVIRQTATEHNDFITARRGVLTDGEVLDLADAIGMDPATLNGRKIGQAFNAEQIVAARKLLIKSATNVRDLMAKAAQGSDAEVMAYAEAKIRHAMIQQQVAGLTAEAGRALRAFRKIEGSDEAKAVGDFLKDATGRTLNQLRAEARLGAALQTPAQVSRYINMTNWERAKSAIIEYYVNCLISGPITHFRYSVGNAINALWSAGIDTPIAALIGGAKEALGLVNEGDRVYMGEAGAQMLAITKGSRDGWRAGYEAFRTGTSPALPGERTYEGGYTQRAIGGTVGEIINIPSKSVGAIHSFFKSIRYEQNMQALAYRTATREGLSGDAFTNRVSDLTLTPSPEMMSAWEDRESFDELESALSARDIARGEGLTGDALDARISDLVTNPTPAMKTDLDSGKFTSTARIIAENAVASTKESLRDLYMSPTRYGTASAFINKAVNKSLVLKIMAPFMKIGMQITRNAFMERTPLGFLDKDIRDNLLGRNGGAAQDIQMARITVGTAVIGITVGMASEGLATGDGPEDPAQRAVWLRSHRPNTLTIGDITIPYQGLGSLGMLMRFSANSYQAASLIGHETADKVALAALEGISKSVLDENFMRGVKDALDAVYHYQEYGPNYIKGFITNWLLFSVGMSQVARQVDPYMRDTRTGDFWSELNNTVISKIPFASESLPAKRDIFGEPILNSGPTPDYSNDPTTKALDALQMGIGHLDPKIRGIRLTPDQYDDYSRIAGRLTKLQMDGIVAIPGFSSLPATTRIDMLHKAISGSRETARSLIMMQSVGGPNDIVRDAIAAKSAAASRQNAGAP